MTERIVQRLSKVRKEKSRNKRRRSGVERVGEIWECIEHHNQVNPILSSHMMIGKLRAYPYEPTPRQKLLSKRFRLPSKICSNFQAKNQTRNDSSVLRSSKSTPWTSRWSHDGSRKTHWHTNSRKSTTEWGSFTVRREMIENVGWLVLSLIR